MSTPPSATPPAIDMRGIAVGTMRDPESPIIEDVNWSVAPGDFWVVGGLQGAGKSDLLMLAGGLMRPARGSYFFFGAEMPIFEDDRLDERLRLGFVFDGGQLFNHLTVAENIALPLRYHRNLTMAEAEGDVRHLLALTELTPWADSTPGAIAVNWRKRVGLARALMLHPEVLLLDNPLANLDVRHRAWWLGFLDQLSAGHPWMGSRPTTLVVTVDDLLPWRNHARQLAVLSGGRFRVVGSWNEIDAASDGTLRELLSAEKG